MDVFGFCFGLIFFRIFWRKSGSGSGLNVWNGFFDLVRFMGFWYLCMGLKFWIFVFYFNLLLVLLVFVFLVLVILFFGFILRLFIGLYCFFSSD